MLVETLSPDQAPPVRIPSGYRLPRVSAIRAEVLIAPAHINDQRAIVHNPSAFAVVRGFAAAKKRQRGQDDGDQRPTRRAGVPTAIRGYASYMPNQTQHISASTESYHTPLRVSAPSRLCAKSSSGNCPSASRSLTVTMETLAASERWPSGLRRWSRKPVWVHAHRGFESHPLRHTPPRRGEVLEWPNRRDWKSRVVCRRRPWVRIPPSPPCSSTRQSAHSLSQNTRRFRKIGVGGSPALWIPAFAGMTVEGGIASENCAPGESRQAHTPKSYLRSYALLTIIWFQWKLPN